MSNNTFFRRTATFLRRYPWVMACAYTLIHLWQPKYTLGVVGVMFNAEGQVLLVEHVFHPRKPWGLPGGWVERNEPPMEAVCREIQEELQLNTDIGSLLLIEITEDDIRFLGEIIRNRPKERDYQQNSEDCKSSEQGGIDKQAKIVAEEKQVSGRIYPRFKVINWPTIILTNDEVIDGTARNLSASGAYILRNAKEQSHTSSFQYTSSPCH